MRQLPGSLKMYNLFYYKDKPYSIVAVSKIKASGIAKLIYENTNYGEACDLKYIGGDEWIDVVIYECQYENPDGQIWVREFNQFFELFKPKT